MYTIFEPKTKKELENYYRLRWMLLRRPWGKERGTEIDEMEHSSHHRAVKNLDDCIIGIGRIHFDRSNGQIRYMAVKKDFWRKGIGSLIITELESIAVKNKIKNIFLNSRENAQTFYIKNGFKTIKRVNSSFGGITHYRMEKILNY
tara:strand:- start:143 stop:580 length:438 start_codon:yes stop_codon:yes gene_type:complete